MMKKHILLTGKIALILSFFTLTFCSDNIDGTKFKPFDGQPIGIYLEDNEDFSLWVEVLNLTGFYNTLNLDGTYTCFVPTNSAMEEFLAGSSVGDLDIDYLKEIVRYHSLGTAIKTTDFREGSLSDTTFTGDVLTVAFEDGGFNNIVINKSAVITERDIDETRDVTNGVIHVLDKVLIPITETLYEKLKADTEFSIFVEAIEEVGLAEMLNVIRKTENGFSIRAYYTVMAVPNSVFNAADINSYDDLKNRYSDSDDVTDPENGLYKYVAYHILEKAWYFNDLGDFSNTDKDERVILSLAPSELVMVQQLNGEIIINNDDILDNAVRIDQDKFNMNTKNGTYHRIDNLMPVFNPPPVVFQWDPNEIVENQTLNIYGANAKLDHMYLAEDAPLSRWNWNIVDGNVFYHTHLNKNLVNNDWAEVWIRGRGWWEFTTPMVIKGKYKVTFQCWGCNNNLPSIFEVSVGDKSLGTYNFQAGPCGKTFSIVMDSDLDLPKNQEVTFKFTMLEAGKVKIDYVKLEPIN